MFIVFRISVIIGRIVAFTINSITSLMSLESYNSCKIGDTLVGKTHNIFIYEQHSTL